MAQRAADRVLKIVELRAAAIDLRRTDAPDGRSLTCVLALNPPRRIGDPALDPFEMGFEMPRVDPDAEVPPLQSGILGATADWRMLPPDADGAIRVEQAVANSLRTTQALGEVMSRDDPMIVVTLPASREDRITRLGRFNDFDKRDAVDACLCELDPDDSLMYVACRRAGR